MTIFLRNIFTEYEKVDITKLQDLVKKVYMYYVIDKIDNNCMYVTELIRDYI